MNNNLALFLTHHVFLTDIQIKDLFQKKTLSTIGVSVPVWVNAKTSVTSEPALEVFCEYEISIEDKNDVGFSKKGYVLSLINKPNKKIKPIDFENLSKMSGQERSDFEKKRDKSLRDIEINLENLSKVGYFRIEIKKIDQTFEKLEDCLVDIQHVVEIKRIDNLIKTLVM